MRTLNDSLSPWERVGVRETVEGCNSSFITEQSGKWIGIFNSTPAGLVIF